MPFGSLKERYKRLLYAGASLIEFGLLIALIAVVAVVAIQEAGRSSRFNMCLTTALQHWNSGGVYLPNCYIYVVRCRVFPCQEPIHYVKYSIRPYCENPALWESCF